AGHLPGYLPWSNACQCRRTIAGPSPDAFFSLDLRSRAVTEDFNAAANQAAPSYVYTSSPTPTAASDVGARVASDEFRRWITDSLAARVRSRGGLNRGFRFVL